MVKYRDVEGIFTVLSGKGTEIIGCSWYTDAKLEIWLAKQDSWSAKPVRLLAETEGGFKQKRLVAYSKWAS